MGAAFAKRVGYNLPESVGVPWPFLDPPIVDDTFWLIPGNTVWVYWNPQSRTAEEYAPIWFTWWWRAHLIQEVSPGVWTVKFDGNWTFDITPSVVQGGLDFGLAALGNIPLVGRFVPEAKVTSDAGTMLETDIRPVRQSVVGLNVVPTPGMFEETLKKFPRMRDAIQHVTVDSPAWQGPMKATEALVEREREIDRSEEERRRSEALEAQQRAQEEAEKLQRAAEKAERVHRQLHMSAFGVAQVAQERRGDGAVVGLAIDVSGSMESAMDNVTSDSRMNAVLNEIGALAKNYAKEVRLSAEHLHLRAPNPIWAFCCCFGCKGSNNVRDLFTALALPTNTMKLDALADHFGTITSDFNDVQPYGGTPMKKALGLVRNRFISESRNFAYAAPQKMLIIITDGCSTDGQPFEEVRGMHDEGVFVVGCYLTGRRESITSDTLHCNPEDGWSDAAKFVFGCCSPLDNALACALRSHSSMKVCEGSRLFLHVNDACHLEDFLALARRLLETDYHHYWVGKIERDEWATKYSQLQLGPAVVRADKALFREAVASWGRSLKFAALDLKADKDIVLAAVENDGLSLAYASDALRADADVVLAAITNNPMALEFASDELRGKPPGCGTLPGRDDLVEIAIKGPNGKGTALKFAYEPQREDLLKMAGLWSRKDGKLPALVESVRYSLKPGSTPAASNLHIYILEHDFFKKFQIYTPNQVMKDFCHAPDYKGVTDLACQCKGGGFGESCWPRNQAMNSNTCWRYSFRQHEVQAKDTQGFVLQVIEGGELGDGQKIEELMAMEVGVPVVQVKVDPEFDPYKYEDDRVIIENLIKEIQGNAQIKK